MAGRAILESARIVEILKKLAEKTLEGVVDTLSKKLLRLDIEVSAHRTNWTAWTVDTTLRSRGRSGGLHIGVWHGAP